MVWVEELEVGRGALDVVWPAGWFDEGPASVITELVDGCDQLSEMNRGVGVKLVDSDFSDGSSKHVSDIPPAKHQRQQKS